MTVSVLFYGFLCIFALTTLTGWNRSHDKKKWCQSDVFQVFFNGSKCDGALLFSWFGAEPPLCFTADLLPTY